MSRSITSHGLNKSALKAFFKVFQSRLSRRNCFLLTIFVVAALVRTAALLINPENLVPEEIAPAWEKIYYGFKWAHDPTLKDLVFANGYPPLHSIVIGTFYMLAPDAAVWLARLFSLGFSLLFLGFIYTFTKKLFNSGAAALAAFVIYAFCPSEIVLAGLSVPEVPAYCLLFMAAYFLTLGAKSVRDGIWFLIASALTLSMANILRYESWIYNPLFLLFLVLKQDRRHWGEIGLYAVLSNFTAVGWLILDADGHQGRWFAFYMESCTITGPSLEGSDKYHIMRDIFNNFKNQLTAPIFYLGLAGWLLFWRYRPGNIIFYMLSLALGSGIFLSLVSGSYTYTFRLNTAF